ncbi:hypothetical protein A33Q_3453 [Indibacter alkaliphilus LW1]|uniref:Uncharacterized protein n=1 Tax=Indibacter alkaliphilus (strain CCUG 57479 / KCTC 22604 / LW1) TaxID=1189612 RepID=S2DVF4_INDAL|nr:hypothetical protein [Indibacter alkaliphilus]EOZ93848.1 hypothetical protein A33Q_3453 [Indibacter alkaliphilus LW1]
MDQQQIQNIDEKRFFRLPFEKNTFRLSLNTLNAHSNFRKPANFYQIETKILSFKNELLTVSVKLPDEPKKLVYLKVTREELLVSCNFDTDQTYLSRYAYYAILGKMVYSETANFKEYYWPDFFDPNTGRSKFLKIFNDRRGFDINLKPKYPSFYKPGDTLLELQQDQEVPKAGKPLNSLPEELPISDKVMGFALADTNLSSIHSNHYPFLVPFHGILTKDRKKIKYYSSFHLNEHDSSELILSENQKQLTNICFKMRELAPVRNLGWQDKFVPNKEELENGKKLFLLWHHAFELIQSQKHLYFACTMGLKNLKRKPSRSWMNPCEFKKERPQLVIKRIDKGDYFQIELAFKINGKLKTLYYPDLAFFVRPKSNWLHKYLLGSFNDYLLTSFFRKTCNKLAVLKPHYAGDFESFMNKLEEKYEIIDF